MDPDGRQAAPFNIPGLITYRVPTPLPASHYTGQATAALGFAADLTPGIGDAKAIYEAWADPSFINVASAVIGFVPLVGDIGGKLLKHSDEAWAAIRGGCSFDGQTLVATDGNPTAIQDIRVGARVLARDEKTGEERYQKVTAVISEWHDEALEVTFQSDRSSETILTTDEHPFFEVGIGFVPASQLRVGAQVLRASGQLARVERMRETKGGLAWNLTVESDHTFFVGQGRYWVHNQCIRGVSGESPALGGSPYHPDAVNERIRPPLPGQSAT